MIWALRDEVRPVDLYCYLWARFGPPNGFQNFLRKDDSDNLIHWDWTLSCNHGWMIILGMNFRTEVQFVGCFPFSEADKDKLIQQLKSDFANFGKQMSEIRKTMLETWTEFINPYHRLRSSVDQLHEEIKALSLDPSRDAFPDLIDSSEGGAFETKWKDVSIRYNKGVGICFGIRSMLPVMAEAFVNLLLFVLMKTDLKSDPRLRENTIRQQIDIRIKSLHLTCIGFARPVDYSHTACGNYHSLVNERNDLLHGNVVIEKLRFNEVYFNGRVPIFKDYRSMWERSLGVEVSAVGLDRLTAELRVIDEFVAYVLSCLQPDVREQIERIMQNRDLGLNKDTGRIGILFPGHLVDMQLVMRAAQPCRSE